MASIGKKFNDVTFVFDRKPEAKKVYVVGTFTHWDPTAVPMSRTREGNFKVRCKLPSGRHEYKFFVDGEWLEDPASTERVLNPFGTYNNIVQVK